MWEKKKSNCPKKKFKVWKGKKNVSVGFRVFGKKNGNRKKSSGKKNRNVLGGNLKWKILLSSCSLVGLYVCKLKLWGKR